MRHLHVDIETRSRAELTKTGVYRYVECPDFRVMLISYALDNRPVELIDLTTEYGTPRADRFFDMLADPSLKKVAFNAQFERVCLTADFGIECPPEQWECAMVRALAMGFPGRLGDVGERVGIPEDKRKLGTGLRLIRKFCMPDKKTGRFSFPEYHEDDWALFREYCIRDTEAEREIYKRLALFPLRPEEQRLWELDQRINDRGVKIHAPLATAAIAAAGEEIGKLEAEAISLTGLSNPGSRHQLLAWLRAEQEGEGLVETKDLKKKTVAKLLRTDQPIVIDNVLRLRQEISKSSIAKYGAMLRGVCGDGRLRGLLQFYGAIRTGRWAGRLVQVQNLPQNLIEDLREMRAILLADPHAIGMFHDSVLGVLSELIRTAFIPGDGARLISVDFSAIEARVIAWVAHEAWRMDVFATHGKIYEASAEQMFRLPAGSVTKGDPLRQKGKIAELALGFQGGVGALELMGALDMGLTADELPEIKDRWRAASPSIVCLWYAMEETARKALFNKGQRIAVAPAMSRLLADRGIDPLPATAGVHRVAFEYSSGCLFMHLPSGRRLTYPKPRVEEGAYGPKVTFMGLHPLTHKWSRCDTFGGRLVENLVQATARDCLREAMFRADETGLDIVFTVHDEMVLEVGEDEAESALEDLLAIMADPIDWAQGLPLKADGDVLDFYRKA